jgi:hypothetical protein
LSIWCNEWCGSGPPYFLAFPQKGSYTYGPPSNIEYLLSSNEAGADAVHTLTFDTNLGDLKTLAAVVTYPKEFTFNGFSSLGPPNSEVGTMCADVDFAGDPEVTAPVLSLSDFSAYVDLDGNDEQDFDLEPSVYFSKDLDGNGVLRIDALPNQNPADLVGNVALRMTFVMNAGVMTNPTEAGVWMIAGQFESIDPDTGGGDNGTGEAPQTLNLSEEIVIGDPVDFIYVSTDGTCSGKTPCYDSVQEAINNASTVSTILITQESYNEDISLSEPKTIIVQSGLDSSYTTVLGISTVNSMTISKGIFRIDKGCVANDGG